MQRLMTAMIVANDMNLTLDGKEIFKDRVIWKFGMIHLAHRQASHIWSVGAQRASLVRAFALERILALYVTNLRNPGSLPSWKVAVSCQIVTS